jgi:hypothetical protein
MYRVTVTVNPNNSSQPIQNASVTLGNIIQESDVSGKVYFTVVDGDYKLEISKEGYIAVSETLSVKKGVSISRELSLVPKTAYYDINVLVVDASNSMKLSNASVSLGNNSAITDAYGLAKISIPKGEYTLTIGKTGYGPSNESLTVIDNVTMMRSLANSVTIPEKYNVTVVLTDESSSPLVGARVEFSGVASLTNTSGCAKLSTTGGSYPLKIKANGFNQIDEILSVSSETKVYRTLVKEIAAPMTPPAKPSINNEVSSFSVTAMAIGYLLAFLYVVGISKNAPMHNRLSRLSAGLGYSAWGISLSTLLLGFIRSKIDLGFYLNIDAFVIANLAALTLLSVSLATGSRKRTVAIVSGLAASALMIYVALGSLPIVALNLLISISLIWNEYKSRTISDQKRNLRFTMIKTNRAISWLLAAFTVAAMVSGYILTTFHLFTPDTYVLHTALGMAFGGLLGAHILLALASKYPWVGVLKGLMKVRSHPWSFVRAFQVISAVALVAFGVIQFASGLGFINAAFASLIPVSVHLSVDGALLALFIFHAGIGMRAVTMRYRITFPGLNPLIASTTAILMISVLVLTMAI